ncbi:recombinase family protein [Pseudomonas aeruginosa]|uniref:recombinase family protein n=1 Tax=Pseudomonas aeruginosa TaxID=287 RepID=UPI003CC53B03
MIEKQPVVAYLRVSTGVQESSGLGLEAQREYCQTAAKQHGLEIVAEYIDVCSGSVHPHKRENMPKALEHGLPILAARVDRVGRVVSHVSSLMDEGVILRIATMMQADTLQINIYLSLAQAERDFIRQRTKDALQALKERAESGCPESKAKVARRSEALSKGRTAATIAKAHKALTSNANAFAESVRSDFESCLFRGCNTLQSMADCLNGRKVATARGCEWTPIAVSRLMKRLNLAF